MRWSFILINEDGKYHETNNLRKWCRDRGLWSNLLNEASEKRDEVYSMRIKNATIKNLGPFDDLEMSFGDIVIVAGENGFIVAGFTPIEIKRSLK